MNETETERRIRENKIQNRRARWSAGADYYMFKRDEPLYDPGKTRDLLSTVSSIIGCPDQYVKGWPLAINYKGEKCDPKDPEAKAWSVLGAINALDTSIAWMSELHTIIELHIPAYMDLPSWEELSGTTHNDVLDLLDKIIHDMDTILTREDGK